jgi:hypothetical protein
MYSLRPSPSLPIEVLGMIAKEADDGDIPAHRLVCYLRASLAAARFALKSCEIASKVSPVGLAKKCARVPSTDFRSVLSLS